MGKEKALKNQGSKFREDIFFGGGEPKINSDYGVCYQFKR